MATATREAFGAAEEKLSAGTAKAPAAQRTAIADEILAVGGLLRGEPRLRRALTDPARPGSARAELLVSLLGGKVSTTAVDALAVLVAGRWSRPTELLDATERLGVDALLGAADK